MAHTINNENPRTVKTFSTLKRAIESLLNKREFARITVNDICAEAWISRTAFYAHFKDKYDLLDYFLTTLASEISTVPTEKKADFINGFIRTNPKIVIHILEGASKETMAIVKDFIRQIIMPSGASGVRQTVLESFCVGGILGCIMWQLDQRFPDELELMNQHMCEIFNAFKNLEQDT